MKVLFGIFLCFLFSVSFSQSLQNTGMPIGITEGAVLKVNENFVNAGNLLNAGQIIVGGHWVNTGVYQTSGTGVVDMNGSLTQSINDQSFIERLRLSGANKTLNTNLTVDHLELNGSLLTIGNGFGLEIAPGGSITRQPNDYIIGRLVMTGSSTYPIGTTNYFLPVTLNQVTGDALPIGIQAVESPLQGPLDNTIAEIAPFHWVMDESDEEFNVLLGFENADFLQEIEYAMVVQSGSANSTVYSLYQDSTSGDVDLGYIANDPNHPLTLSYFSIGRKYLPKDKPPVKVLNLISPNGDGKNEFLFIENIDAYPECLVVIYDRWGTKVFEQKGYDNREKVFRGFNNVLSKAELTEGTFYYVIRSEGQKLGSGFIELMR
ncbi:MAG: gliding motility-associated C-terminal domain-containing protein [Cyclobacteriaceae bacterium]|nr:gliding motility-associated C-terminal domain-containing protein [Cyclobacteriaceae bacterium SS2]